MKKNRVTMFLVIVSVTIIMAGCATTSVGTDDTTVIPGPNESVIVVKRISVFTGSAISMKIWVDDVEKASSIRNGQEVRFIISDGEHMIRAGSTAVDKGKSVSFSAAGEEISFFAEPQMGVLAARFKLTQIGKRKI